jgi:dCMP deaminase
MTRPRFCDLMMDFAHALSARSTCARLQVGCVITSPDYRRVYAIGYNGGAAGDKNECESDVPGQCGHIHAEANAIINCDVLRSTEKFVFSTHLPCAMCSKMLVNLGGVVQVVYRHDYRLRDGVGFLERAGIAVVHQP